MAHAPRRILVPIDFSPSSDCALALASELAPPFDAEVHLLNVRTVVDDPVVSPDDLHEVERILAISDAEAQQKLEASATGIGAPAHCHIKRGVAPAAAILDAISEHHIDLVIMGTQGRRGLRGMLMGSVAKEVIHRSPVPVLTTRAETDRTFPPKRLLVAYDSSEDSLQAVLLAAEWASRLSSEVTLLHVMEPITYPDFYAHYTLREDHMKRISENCQDALSRVGAEYLSTVAHETAVIHARAADGIVEFASNGEFDLVVLATRGLSGIARAVFGSVADRVTQLSEVPVLTVREAPPTPRSATKDEKKSAKRPRRNQAHEARSAAFSVERSPHRTILRLQPRESLAGADLRLITGLWRFFEVEARDPRPIVVILVPPNLLGPGNLERLLGAQGTDRIVTPSETKARIIREENVIQRIIQAVRSLNSFVVGATSGDVALQLAAPLFACDYRIVSPDTVFVNTTRSYPRSPLGCMPWLLSRMVGSAKAGQLLLDVPMLSAKDALELALVNHVTAPDRLEHEALEVADRLGSLPRATLVALKRATTASNEDLETYLRQELALVEQLASPIWEGQRPT
jgi:nucleotide-binding universal stress UspA family protein/enoyl-CoA hydratase/carnithine racemase